MSTTTTTTRRGPAGLVGGIAAGVLALALLAASALGFAFDSAHNSRGYISTGTAVHSTSGYALESDGPRLYGFGGAPKVVGSIRVQVESSRRVFVGIAPAHDVDAYLSGVARNRFDALDNDASTDRPLAGGRPAGAPASKGFWVATSVGRGAQSLTWKPQAGRWRLVVMAPDGSRDVKAALSLGARFPHLQRIALVLLGIGLTFGALAAVLIRLGVRRSRV